PIARLAVVALALASPVTFKALYFGHPEELLGAAMCAGALLLAARGRSLAAGVLLGLAIATKQWAVLAFVPTLLAAREARRRPDRRPEDALALLALILLLRCLLDPLTYSYHHAPFLIALVAYEAVRRRGVPVLGLFAALMLWLTASVVAPGGDPYLLNRFY